QKSSIDPDLEKAFRQSNVDKFGEKARNSAQTTVQILVASYISKFQHVHLGMGGGKTEAGQLGLAQILLNKAKNANATIETLCGLYISKDSQIEKDLVGFYNFLTNPAIYKLLVSSGYIEDGQEIKIGYMKTNTEGKKEFFTVTSKIENKKVASILTPFTGTLAELQDQCIIVGGVMSSFSHERQMGNFSNKQKFFGLNDEGHISLVDSADSPNSIASQESVMYVEEKKNAMLVIFETALKMYDEYQENPKKSSCILLGGKVQIFEDKYVVNETEFNLAKEKYPQLDEQEWKHYVNSALDTISEFRGQKGENYSWTSDKVNLMSFGNVNNGQKRRDWGQLFLERLIEVDSKGKFTTDGKYTVETITISEQTNDEFINSTCTDGYVAYSGSLSDITKAVKRLYGRSVKIVKSLEVANPIDEGTRWFLKEDNKIDEIIEQIKTLLTKSDSSVIIRIDNAEQREKLKEELKKIVEIEEFTAENEKWNTDRDAYIGELKNFITGKAGRVAIVTTAFTTGVDLRTNNIVKESDLLDSNTGSFITEDQLKHRVGRGKDVGTFKRFYSVESLQKFNDGDGVKSVLITKIEKAVKKGNAAKAIKLYKKLQDILFDESIARSESIKNKGKLKIKVSEAYIKNKDLYSNNSWQKSIFGKEYTNEDEYDAYCISIAEKLANEDIIDIAREVKIISETDTQISRETRIAIGKILLETLRIYNDKKIDEANKNIRVGIEEADIRSYYTMGNGIISSMKKMAEINPEVENADRTYRTIDGFYESVQQKAMINFRIPCKSGKAYTSAIFGKAEGSIYKVSSIKTVISKVIGNILKFLETYAPLLIKTGIIILGLMPIALTGVFPGIMAALTGLFSLSMLSPLVLLGIIATGVVLLIVVKNLIIDKIQKYDQESDRKLSVSEFKANPSIKTFAKATFAVLNKILTSTASTTLIGGLVVGFIGIFVQSVLPLAVVFIGVGVLASILLFVFNVNKLSVMSKVVPEQSSEALTGVMTGIGAGMAIFAVATGIVSVPFALLGLGAFLAVQYAGKTDYMKFGRIGLFAGLGLAGAVLLGVSSASLAAIIPTLCVIVMVGMIGFSIIGAISRKIFDRLYVEKPLKEKIEKFTTIKTGKTATIFNYIANFLDTGMVKVSAFSLATIALSPVFAFINPLVFIGISISIFIVGSVFVKVIAANKMKKQQNNLPESIEIKKIKNLTKQVEEKRLASEKAQNLREAKIVEITKKFEPVTNRIKTFIDSDKYRSFISSKPVQGFFKVGVGVVASVIVMAATTTTAYASSGEEESTTDT
ncbi:MAG: sulfite exporter TauE/SafE family protein, partial [Endomicrobiia bacterium]